MNRAKIRTANFINALFRLVKLVVYLKSIYT